MKENKKEKELTVGGLAPDFTLPDQDGKEHTLSQYHGKWVLLYFYPKDDTPGCTLEACTLAQNWPEFKKHKAVVLGVSIDKVEKHKKFVEKYTLPFTLLSDVEKKVVTFYGVFGEKKFLGRTYMGTRRISFLIDPVGKIAKIYNDVKPLLHADEVLTDLKMLQK